MDSLGRRHDHRPCPRRALAVTGQKSRAVTMHRRQRAAEPPSESDTRGRPAGANASSRRGTDAGVWWTLPASVNAGAWHPRTRRRCCRLRQCLGQLRQPGAPHAPPEQSPESPLPSRTFQLSWLLPTLPYPFPVATSTPRLAESRTTQKSPSRSRVTTATESPVANADAAPLTST
jgi:hypothetical protein